MTGDPRGSDSDRRWFGGEEGTNEEGTNEDETARTRQRRGQVGLGRPGWRSPEFDRSHDRQVPQVGDEVPGDVAFRDDVELRVVGELRVLADRLSDGDVVGGDHVGDRGDDADGLGVVNGHGDHAQVEHPGEIHQARDVRDVPEDPPERRVSEDGVGGRVHDTTVDPRLPGDARVGDGDPARNDAALLVDRETPLEQQEDDRPLTGRVLELREDLLEHRSEATVAGGLIPPFQSSQPEGGSGGPDLAIADGADAPGVRSPGRSPAFIRSSDHHTGMRELDRCDFCGEPTAGLYEPVPDDLPVPGAPPSRLALCADCRDSLADIVEPLVTALRDSGVAASGSAEAPTGNRDATNASDAGDRSNGSATDRASRGDASDGSATTRTTSGGGEPSDSDPSPGADPDGGSSGERAPDAPAEARSSGTDAEASAPAERGVTLGTPEVSTSESGDQGGSHGPDAAGGDQHAGADESSAATGVGDSRSVPPAYPKVMRFLRNRELPMDRDTATTLAASAYDLEPHEVAEVFDLAIDLGDLAERDGELDRP